MIVFVLCSVLCDVCEDTMQLTLDRDRWECEAISLGAAIPTLSNMNKNDRVILLMDDERLLQYEDDREQALEHVRVFVRKLMDPALKFYKDVLQDVEFKIKLNELAYGTYKGPAPTKCTCCGLTPCVENRGG